ncbi:MAG: septum formation initiator family protein [bacterium]|nr:septum formation initiator family protein [bacterium]MXZ30529.1 septum formation initiator family protein [Acidimicrobiia bacterium]MDE0668796.1 septum formation initiator family protein [bacterium]MXZ31023.1 septum formation initiator family protein [Acidimicrobiia bacterium]MYE67426.1 septum formation initiator family protein [Acidimicrobiia bacterium]
MTPVAARRVLRALVVVAVSGAAVAITWTWGVNPVQNWFAQRDQIAQLEARLAEVQASNADLAAEIERLQTDAEIERIARRDLGLVYPGEEAYAINLPAEVLGSG